MKKTSKRLSLVLTVVMVLSLLIPMNALLADDSTMAITVLGTSDLHANITTFDYYTQKVAEQGIAKVYSVVKEARAKNPNTILIDNGDTIQGTPFAQYYLDNFNSKSAAKIINPMINIMNMMKYDAWTLGNHEFNYGLPLLEQVMTGAKFPVLSANIYKADGTNFVKPYIIKEINGAKIGILGFTTTGVTTWDKNNVKDLKFNDIVAEGKKWVKVLKETEKVDAIIVSAHSGIESVNDILNENQVKALANACPEITAIISGHAHLDVAGQTENGVLIVQPKKWGSRVSEIDLTLTKVDGKWTVAKKESKNIDVKTYPQAQEVLDVVKTDIEAVDKAVNTVIGTSTAEFSGIGQQLKDTALVDLIQKVQMDYGKADVSIAASFNDSSRIPAGDVKVSDINALYVYENFLNVTEMTGKQLKAFIEYSAKYFNQMKPGDTVITFDPNVPGYNYDMVQGINYQLDLTQPAGSRVVNMTFKGKPVTDTQTFRVALNNYRFGGGGGHMAAAGLTNPKNLYDSQVAMGDLGQIRTMIIEYIKKNKTISPIVDNNYNLITVPSTRYTAKTGDTLATVAAKYNKNAEELLTVNNMTAADVNTPLMAGRIVFVPKPDTVKKITLLSVNDFHGVLAEDAKAPGIAKLVGYLKDQKKYNENGTFILSAGDMSQGTADSNLLYGQPVYAGMNEAGFDAMEIGNHEFDWGLEKLAERAKEADFPLLAANIYDKATNKPVDFVKPYVILEKNGVKVAFIGVITPETATTTLPAIVEPYEFKDPTATVNAISKELRDSKAADMIVVIAHMSAYQDAKTGAITGEIAELAKDQYGVNAIISGHSHTLVGGYCYGIPVVQGYYNGRGAGHIDLYYDTVAKRQIDSKAYAVSLNPTNTIVDAAAKAAYDKTAELIAPIKNELLGKAAVELGHAKDTKQVTLLGEWVTDTMRKAAKADIAFQNGGGLRRNMPAGDITMGLMYEIMPFDNTLYTFTLKGSEVRKAVECGIMPATVASGQFSGINVKYDSSKPYGSRVVEIKLLDGTLLDDNKDYKIVTNDFQATGGDGYTMFKNAPNSVNTNIPVRDTLVNEIKAQGTINQIEDNRIIDVNQAETTGMLYFDIAA